MAPIDPRTIPATTQIGTKLRDAAVDPRADDFLPPINAGEVGELGNPHGPTVVSPELHASQGVRPIRPGDVSDDPEEQSDDETEHLAAWQPQTDPVNTVAVTGTNTVAVGATTSLVATATRENTGAGVVTTEATWSTSDATKATVSQAGVVTGVAAGTATITAAFDGKSGTRVVTVTA